MSTDDRSGTQHTNLSATAAQPISAQEAQHAKADARQRAARGGEPVLEGQRKSRVEADLRRISEEVTCLARQRVRVTASLKGTEPAAVITDAPAQRTDAPVRASSEPATTLALAARIRPWELRQILVPLDGTSRAERAVPFAASLALANGARVTLVHVQAPVAPHPAALLDKLTGGSLSEARELTEDQVAQTIHHAHELFIAEGIDTQTVTAMGAVPGHVVAGLATQLGADVIVVAPRIHQQQQQRVLGPFVDDLLTRAHSPLLLISARAAARAATPPEFTRILVPLDESELSEQALVPLLTLLRLQTHTGIVREVLLLHVDDSGLPTERDTGYLSAIRALLEMHPELDGTHVASMAAKGDVARRIVDTAHGQIRGTDEGLTERFDLVVIARHGRGGLCRWLFGSVAADVVPRLDVPVLVLPSAYVAREASSASHAS